MEDMAQQPQKPAQNFLLKRVFLNHWIDWTIAIIIMVFIVVYGAVQKYSIEQDYGNENNITAQNIDRGLKIVSTNAWQKYTSREFNFEFLYPNSWSTNLREPDLEIKNTILGPAQERSGTYIPQIDFTIFSDPENTAPLQWFMKKFPTYSKKATLDYEPFAIGTIDGVKVLKRNPASGELDVNIFFLRDGRIFLFHAAGEEMPILEALIASFRFIDFSDPRNWDVYKSEKHSITLHPKYGLKITEQGDGLVVGNCSEANTRLLNCSEGSMFVISVHDGYTFNDSFSITGKHPEDFNTKCKKTMVGGRAAYDCSFGITKWFYVQANNNLFEITYLADYVDGDKMLSTLGFLDSKNNVGFYDRNKWQLVDSKSTDFDGDAADDLVLLLKSLTPGGKDYEGNDLFFFRMIIIKNNAIVYSFEPRNGTRGPFLMNDKLEIRDVTRDGLPEAVVYWGDKQTQEGVYTAIHVAHFDSRHRWINNISSDGFYNSKWHDFEWADFGDKLQIATSDAIHNTCGTCVDYYKYTIYKWTGDYYVIYKTVEGPKNPVAGPFDEEYIKFIHDHLN